MDTARLLSQLPTIMGLSSAALTLLFIVSLSAPSTTSCMPSHYSLPELKSMCVEYVCSMWSVLSRSSEPVLITPPHLFLIVNVIIFILFISLHLQQHAPAARKRSPRGKRQQHAEKPAMNDLQAAAVQTLQEASLADDLTSSVEAAAMAEEASSSSLCAAELDTSAVCAAELDKEESLEAPGISLGKAQELSNVDSDQNNGPDVEQIVLDEDGRLRLVAVPVSPTASQLGKSNGSDEENGESEPVNGSDAEKSEPVMGSDAENSDPVSGSEAEKIVAEEDEQLNLMQPIDGSDAEKIVLDEDGRLRLIDRPQIPSCSTPRKALSTGVRNYNPSAINEKGNNDTHSVINGDNYDNNQDSFDNQSPNESNSNLNELDNYGTLTIDLSADSRKLNAHHSSFTNKSPPVKRSSSRPIRVKKSESLDATWKAISGNKGTAANRDHKHLIRQSSRQEFKPTRGGMRASNSNNNKVRREPSIGQEELNAKAESFIARFNEQIRIQRQQSLLSSYMQIVNRGA